MTGPNQVWSWDITYLNTSIRGLYYKLYIILDISAEKLLGGRGGLEESGEYAAELVGRQLLQKE